jgi:HEAT repeat protein
VEPAPGGGTAAVRALEHAGGDASVIPLLRAASGGGEEIRGGIVEALCRCFRGRFKALAGMPGESRTGEQTAVLLEMASRLGGDGAREFVDRHVADPDPILRRAAVYALRGFPEDEVRDVVSRALRDPDESVRDAAVLVAASVGGIAMCREIAQCAGDPNGTVRFHVALSLGLSDRPDSRESLRGMAGDPAATVRAAAVLGLSLSGDPRFRGELVRYLADPELCKAARETFLPSSGDPLVRLAVAEARRRGTLEAGLFLGGSLFSLEKEMGQRAREALTEEERLQAVAICEAVATGQSYTTALAILRNDPSPDVRIRALDLLVKARRDAESGRVVGTLLSDPHPKVRVKAARLLGSMEFPSVVESLLVALDTTDRELREEVTTSLSVHLLRDPAHGEALVEEIPSGKARKLGVVWLLGKTRREGSMKALLRYLEDEDGDVRAAAVGALAKYRAGLVARHLRKSLADPNPRVRAAAVNALSAIRTEDMEAAMVGMLSDPDAFVRQRAAMALLRMDAPCVSGRIRDVAGESPELRPVWLAGGVFRGDVPPAEAEAEQDTARFLRELLPESEAVTAARESPVPAQRKTAFRVLQVLSKDLVRDAAEFLSGDPDPGLREEAKAWLLRPGG